MKLSNKKIKYIKRHAAEKTPQQIAKDLRIRVDQVEDVLGIAKQIAPQKTGSFLDLMYRWSLVAIVFAAPFIFVKRTYDFANLPQMGFVQTGAALLLLLWLIKGFTSGQCRILRSPFNLPIFCMILWIWLSLLWAHNRYEGYLLCMHWTACAVMFFLTLNSIRDDRDARRFLTALMLSGSLCAVLGISQHLFKFSWVPQVVSPAAAFANKNMAAHYMVLIFPLTLVGFLESKNKIRAGLYGAMSALMVVFMVYTQTRAGWLAMAMEILFFVILFLRERFVIQNSSFFNRSQIPAATAAVMVLLVMVNLGPEGFKWGIGEVVEKTVTVTDYQETDESQNQPLKSTRLRLDIWLNTFEMVKDRPVLGFGLGNHKVFYPLYFRKVVVEKQFSETHQLTHVHNDFIQAYAELGTVGMLILAWLLFVLAKVVFRLTSAQHAPEIRLRTIGISVAIGGLLVNSCFSFPFQRSIPPFVLMILLGLLGYFYGRDNPKSYTITRKGLILFCTLITTAVLIFLVRFQYLGLKADRHYLNLVQLEKAKIWQGVVEEGRWAYYYHPARVKILSYMGRAYVEMGKHQEGINALEKVISAYPNHMNALLNIGVAYGSIGEQKKALAVYEKVLSIKPDYAKVHNNMANIHMKQGNLAEALREFKKAAELDPENSIIHFNVGIVEMHLKNYTQAAMAYEKAAEFNPKWDLAHKNLGILYYQLLNQKEKGLDHFKKALELNPNLKDGDQIRKLVKRQSKPE